MLVLSRRKKESIRIGEDVKIVVVEIGEDYVRLGFDAPKSVEIFREEIFLKRKREQSEGESPASESSSS